LKLGHLLSEDRHCENCGTKLCKLGKRKSVLCKKCSHLFKRKFEIEKEKLQELVWKIPTTEIA
jgi:uncharacterized Zn finger protein (UPF0148 family)